MTTDGASRIWFDGALVPWQEAQVHVLTHGLHYGTGVLEGTRVFGTAGDPYAILGLLYTPAVRAQLRPLGTGTSSSRRRIDAEDVLSLMVPKLDPAAPDALARAVREAQQQIGTARAALHTLYGG